MSDKEMNMAILNKLYEIADKVFDEGVNVKEGNYTASDLAKMRDSAFKVGYLKTETKSYKNEFNKQVEKDCFIAPMASVNVLSFVCSFCVVQIFALVAKFEKLANIGSSKKRKFVKQKDNNEVLCTVKVLINKYYSKLSLHCANDDLRPAMRNVCLDIRNGRAAASDGHTMMIKGLDVVSTEHFKYDYNLPLVNGKDFKKMCSLAKSGSTLTCKLVREQDGNTYWVSECCGYYSKTEANRYVNYSSVLPKISPDNLCTINGKTWKGISKWLNKNKGFNSIGLVIIKHKENDNRITFTINGMYDNNDGIEISCECENVPNKNFAIGLKIDSLLRFENFNFTLGRYANEALVYVGSLEVGMMMPMYIDDEYDGFKLSDGYIGAYDYCGFAESFDMPENKPTEDTTHTKVDNVTTEEKEEPTDKEESCDIYYTKENGRIVRYDVGTYYKDSDSYLVSKTFVNPSECKVLALSRKELEYTLANYQITEECYNNILYQENYDITQKYLKSEKAKEQSNTPAKVVSLDNHSNKFSFDAIGVNVGDVLTFVDGTKVIAAEDNKVLFGGRLFTLSGFCKDFMPDDKRTKSNTYRGCSFFFKDGVKLEKLFKEQQKKSLVSSKEEIAAVPDDNDSLQNTINAQVKFYLEKVCYILGEDGKPRRWNVIKYLKETDEFVVECMDIPNNPTWIEDRKQFAARYHSMSITESRYYSIINNEPILKEICKGQYKEPLDSVPNEQQASEKCTERTITPLAKENVSERKETASTVKVVSISIGVPVCLYIPPNNMRLDIAANKPFPTAVGDCLCVVGKVVHTLPLPPPRSKVMSEIIKVNQLIKKQKWKRIFVYLADLHSEMANATDW